MNQAELSAEILRLPVCERIELVAQIWDSISQDSLPPLSDADRKLVAERLAAHRANPESAMTLDELRKELSGK